MSNKYIKHAKISETKFRELIKYFVLDLDGLQIAELSGLNRNTVNRYVNMIRKRIAEDCENSLPARSVAKIQIMDEDKPRNDDNYQDSGIIFGLFRDSNKIYTEMVAENHSFPFRNIVRGISPWEAINYSLNYWHRFDGLVEIGKSRHFRLNQDNYTYNDRMSHLNSVKSFWSFTQMRLLKFRGIARDAFYLHLKECEFRFNHRNENLYNRVLGLIQNKPL